MTGKKGFEINNNHGEDLIVVSLRERERERERERQRAKADDNKIESKGAPPS